MQFWKSRRGRLSALIVLCAVIWLLGLWFQLARKTSLLDDAFIYLHIVSNILERGTARFFPIADSAVLLASSPLRMLILLPSAFVARLFVEPDRSLEAARLTLYLSGIITSVMFLPFFRRHMWKWWVGFAAAGVLASCLESGLQMEGLILWWIAFTLLFVERERPSDPRASVRLGLLAGLLLLTRIEFGVVALVLLLVDVALRERPMRSVLAYLGTVAACGLAWVFITVVLDVYPIPSTFLSKILSIQERLFVSGNFASTLDDRLPMLFFERKRLPAVLMWGYVIAVLLAVASARRRTAIAMIGLVAVYFIMRPAPGNYLWYAENLAILLFAASLWVVFVESQTIRAWIHSKRWLAALRSARMLLIASPWILLVNTAFLKDRVMFWNFRAPSRGMAFKALGEHAASGARFEFPGIPPVHVVLGEIGIVAYFGGPDTWMMDDFGLAQPGELKSWKSNPYSHLYPESFQRTALEELDVVMKRFGQKEVYVVRVWGNPGLERQGVCTFYDEATGVCMITMRVSPGSKTPVREAPDILSNEVLRSRPK